MCETGVGAMLLDSPFEFDISTNGDGALHL
jgi:hypothetical protein